MVQTLFVLVMTNIFLGSIVNLHVGETAANIFAVSHFNFPDSYWDILHSLPLHKLAPLLASQPFESTFPHAENFKTADSNNFNENDSTLEADQHISDCPIDSITNNIKSSSQKRKLSLTNEEKSAIRAERQQKRFNHQKNAWNLLKSKSMDALVVASK